jgi:hypothetical protein
MMGFALLYPSYQIKTGRFFRAAQHPLHPAAADMVDPKPARGFNP